MSSQKLPSGFRSIRLLEDQVLVDRPAIRGQPHQLVLAAVDLEATVVGECRIEQAERVRELDLVESVRMRLPLTDPEVVVLHSPTPSSVRIAASSNGLGKNALAAWLSW